MHTHLVVAVVERGRVGSLETRAHGVGRRAGVAQDRVCVRGNVRVAEGIDSLPSFAPFLSLHPVVGDGSLKRGARDQLRVCVFVGSCVL